MRSAAQQEIIPLQLEVGALAQCSSVRSMRVKSVLAAAELGVVRQGLNGWMGIAW